MWNVCAQSVVDRDTARGVGDACTIEPKAFHVRTTSGRHQDRFAASLGVTRGLGSLLYEVPARDPMVLASTSAVLMAVSILAGYLPARRAMIDNPAAVLRAE